MRESVAPVILSCVEISDLLYLRIVNSGVTGEAECPPETSDWDISVDLSGKWRRKEGKLRKGR